MPLDAFGNSRGIFLMWCPIGFHARFAKASMSYHTQIVGSVCCVTHDLKAIKSY